MKRELTDTDIETLSNALACARRVYEGNAKPMENLDKRLSEQFQKQVEQVQALEDLIGNAWKITIQS